MDVLVVRYDNHERLPIQLSNANATAGDLKDELSCKLGVNREQQRLVYSSKELLDIANLHDFGVSKEKIVYLLLRPSYIVKFQVIDVMSGNKQKINLQSWQTVFHLRKTLANFLGKPPDSIVLMDRFQSEINIDEVGERRIFKVFGTSKKQRIYMRFTGNDTYESIISELDAEICSAIGSLFD